MGIVGRSVTLTLSGQPAINTPKSAARDVQIAINNIRERLQAIEAQVTAGQGVTEANFAAGATDLSAIRQQIAQLRAELTSAQLAIAALEAEVPTDVYVNNVFVATRHILNFIQGGGIRITGTDDSSLEQVNILFEALVDLSMIVTRGVLHIRGRDVGFRLGKELDLLRSSLFIRGRTIDMLAGQGISLERQLLRIRGRTIDFTTTGNLMLALERSRLLIEGRTIGMNLTITDVLALDRSRLRILGRSINMLLSESLLLARSRLLIRGRTLGLTLTTDGSFSRNWADFSTADMISLKGTISAATGNLVGTPTSGSVHQRVYFSLLPPGSPSWINLAKGTMDCTANFVANSSTSSLSALLFTVNDAASDNTVQNGYWFDLALQITAARMIRFAAGAGTQVNSFVYNSSSGTHTYRVTRTAAGLWTAFFDGVQKYQSTDTTYTAVRPGLVFFSNPGAPLPVVDYSITWVP